MYLLYLSFVQVSFITTYPFYYPFILPLATLFYYFSFAVVGVLHNLNLSIPDYCFLHFIAWAIFFFVESILCQLKIRLISDIYIKMYNSDLGSLSAMTCLSVRHKIYFDFPFDIV